MLHSYKLPKRVKNQRFLTLSGSIEIEHWLKMGLRSISFSEASTVLSDVSQNAIDLYNA